MSSRELDRKVAEGVMEVKKECKTCSRFQEMKRNGGSCSIGIRRGIQCTETTPDWWAPKFYSSTWEGAGEVVEKMLESGRVNFELGYSTDRGRWEAEFAEDSEPHVKDALYGEAYADTMPEAVSKAAVAAMEGCMPGDNGYGVSAEHDLD